MKSQILMAIAVAIVASVLVTGLASSIYAQSNMTGGNMTIIDTISDGGGMVMTMEAETVMKAEGAMTKMIRAGRAE